MTTSSTNSIRLFIAARPDEVVQAELSKRTKDLDKPFLALRCLPKN